MHTWIADAWCLAVRTSLVGSSLGTFFLYAAAILDGRAQAGFLFRNERPLAGLCVILLLVQVNATPAYLQAATAPSLLLVMHESAKCQRDDRRSGILWVCSLLSMFDENQVPLSLSYP